MALTRDFKETVRARAQNDPSFRLALIEEAMGSLLEGDLDSGRSIMSNFASVQPLDIKCLRNVLGEMRKA